MKILGIVAILLCSVCTLAADVRDVDRQPTCVFGEETFRGGLAGFCEEVKPQIFEVSYRAFDGTNLHKFSWPGEIESYAVTDCEEVCRAGALFLAHATDLLVPVSASARVQQSAASGGGCDLSADASESYDAGPLCDDGSGPFRCHGACGLGCTGCEEKTDQGFCPPLCQSVTLNCYTRPCCSAHDDCLSAATTQQEENACHVQAVQDGCGLGDANGTTNNKPDADCMDFHTCIGGDLCEDPVEVEPGIPVRL